MKPIERVQLTCVGLDLVGDDRLILATQWAAVGMQVNVYYFTAAGALAGSEAFSIAPRGLAVIPTANTVPGASGSIRVTHDGRYGELQGKSVALEPATGFSFDTPMQYKGH